MKQLMLFLLLCAAVAPATAAEALIDLDESLTLSGAL